jgi:hypothetical protein
MLKLIVHLMKANMTIILLQLILSVICKYCRYAKKLNDSQNKLSYILYYFLPVQKNSMLDSLSISVLAYVYQSTLCQSLLIPVSELPIQAIFTHA